jgi:D-methionine transport system substrate-binding protein
MSLFKKYLTLFLLTFFLIFSAACQKSTDSTTLKVGTIAGPETELMQVAQELAKKEYGLDVKVIPFTDYTIPNEALADGSIDVNVFQHAPYLREAVAKRHYKIVEVGKTFIYPMGLYSSKIRHIEQLAPGATVAIPNDASNEARALLLLQSAGLITLKTETSGLVTPRDIVSNPKNLKWKEIDASQLPRVLTDVDIAAINTNYAMLADLLPSRDALFVEAAHSPYANIIVVKEGDEGDARIKQLIRVLHSDAVLKKADTLFKGQALPAWKQ